MTTHLACIRRHPSAYEPTSSPTAAHFRASRPRSTRPSRHLRAPHPRRPRQACARSIQHGHIVLQGTRYCRRTTAAAIRRQSLRRGTHRPTSQGRWRFLHRLQSTRSSRTSSSPTRRITLLRDCQRQRHQGAGSEYDCQISVRTRRRYGQGAIWSAFAAAWRVHTVVRGVSILKAHVSTCTSCMLSAVYPMH